VIKLRLCGEAAWWWYVSWLSMAKGPLWIVAACLAEWWSAWSTRHCGQAVECCFFLLDVSLLDVYSFFSGPCMLTAWKLVSFILISCCSAWPAIGWLKSCGHGLERLFCWCRYFDSGAG
jgi:hypothetical protein